MKATQTCDVPDCDAAAYCRSWCVKHYNRWLDHGDPTYVRPVATCKEEACGGVNEARGWCAKHYNRWRKYGDPNVRLTGTPTATCDAPDCDQPSPSRQYCWMHHERMKRNGHLGIQERTRHTHVDGYVVIKADGHPLAQADGWVYEHRAVLLDKIGPGEHPCHWCATIVSWDRRYPVDVDALVVDHLDRVTSNNDPGNLVPSCQPCNFARGRA